MATPTTTRPVGGPKPMRTSPATSVARWLTRDFAPLDGRVRAVFFALVLVVGARFFWLTVPAAVRAVPAELYDGAGLFGLLVDDRATALTMVEVLRGPLLVALALSALGLGGRVPMLFAGLASFAMVGAYLSGTGTGHSWYVAIVAMIVLGLTHRPARWSLDAVVARRWPRYPFGRRHDGASATGLKLILVYAVFTLFAGGCTKLMEAGWRWMDGASIRFYLAEHGAPKGPLGRAVTELLLDHAWVAVTVSVLTIVVELAAVLTLTWPGFRLVYFAVLAAGFHLATWLLMLPEFFPQLITYVLVIEWARIEWRRPWVRRPSPGRAVPASSPRLAVAVLGALVLVLGASIAARVERYPLTNIPMYSSYVDGREISGLPTATFASERELCGRATDLRSRTRPWYAEFYVADRLTLRRRAGPDVGIADAVAVVGGNSRFWLDELGADALNELTCAAGAVDAAGMAHTQQALVNLHDELGLEEQVELVLPFDDGTAAVLATAGDPP